MQLTDKIKLILQDKNITSAEYQRALHLARPQALNTKYMRNSFSVRDLTILAELTDTELAFVNKKTGETVLNIVRDDLQKNNDK